MSEESRLWYCVNPDCGAILGWLEGRELAIRLEGVTQAKTMGPNLLLVCAECGTKKVWYTSDVLSRATTQLVDAMAMSIAQAANRVIAQNSLKAD